MRNGSAISVDREVSTLERSLLVTSYPGNVSMCHRMHRVNYREVRSLRQPAGPGHRRPGTGLRGLRAADQFLGGGPVALGRGRRDGTGGGSRRPGERPGGAAAASNGIRGHRGIQRFDPRGVYNHPGLVLKTGDGVKGTVLLTRIHLAGKRAQVK